MVDTNGGKLPYALEEALARVGAMQGLTKAEAARLQEIVAGLTYKEMAAQHYLSPNTVKTQVAAVLHKLGVRSRREIENAVNASVRRWERVATEEELYRFLLARLDL